VVLIINVTFLTCTCRQGNALPPTDSGASNRIMPPTGSGVSEVFFAVTGEGLDLDFVFAEET